MRRIRNAVKNGRFRGTSPQSIPGPMTPTLEWTGDETGLLRLIDQTLLPTELRVMECRTVDDVREAIQSLRVRGAPAIGVAAGYGVIIGLQSAADGDADLFHRRLQEVTDQLATSRPTAVNLFRALDRLRKMAGESLDVAPRTLLRRLFTEAREIEAEDRGMCAAIGRHGAELLSDGTGVLTHCNAGGLATAGDGTALSVIFAATEQGRNIHVFADETRPLLQGARLTAWELGQRGVPATLICDSMAGQVMKEGRVQAVITGADRIAANGDAANKIGTYSIAVLAQVHGIPFYVAAPSSTFDLSLATGESIPIEQRAAAEVTHGFGRQTAPESVNVYNPAFDVTPADHITAIVTERGVIRPVNEQNVRGMVAP